MFGIPGFQKLALLIMIVVALWYGFKFIGQLERQRRELARRAKDAGRTSGAAVEDTVKCPVCGTYVARAGAGSCGRADCPY
ncbi:MAG: hypothetical protein ACREEE_06380 [Dongiaceae bacterium]